MSGTGCGVAKVGRALAMETQHEVGIVFMHHTCDEVTTHHLNSITKHNPGVPIITVSGSDELFPSIPSQLRFSYAARNLSWGNFAWWRVSKSGQKKLAWACQDLLLYGAVEKSPVRCKRWCVFEWDTLVTVHVMDAFVRQWDADLATYSTHFPKTSRWGWFRQTEKLPTLLQPYAAGSVPLGAFLASNRLLRRIILQAPMFAPWEVISEMRIATLCNYFGMKIMDCPWMKNHVSWLPDKISVKATPGIYHPVKTLTPKQPLA